MSSIVSTPARRGARLCLVLIAALASADCNDLVDPETCGPEGNPDVIIAHNGEAATISSALETELVNGQRQFTWSAIVENICADEHVQAAWVLDVNNTQIPAGFRVDAGWVISPVIGSEVVLKAAASPQGSSHISYEAKEEVGLAQVYLGKPGRFLPFLAISFDTKGSLAADFEALKTLVSFFQVTARHKLYKAPS